MGRPPRSRWRMFACATAGCSSCGPILARRRSLSHRARTDGAAMASMFDAHDRAFAFFKGTCTRGIYDNMKTAVETIFVGKERLYNRRFLQMASHYLVEPVACTPASGSYAPVQVRCPAQSCPLPARQDPAAQRQAPARCFPVFSCPRKGLWQLPVAGSLRQPFTARPRRGVQCQPSFAAPGAA